MALLLCAAAAMGLSMAGAGADGTVPYVEYSWDGSSLTEISRSTTDAVPFPSGTEVAGGWYIVDRNVTVNGRVSLTGDTHLILGDGYTLDMKGLYIPAGSTLTIYSQSTGNNKGKLNSHPSGGAAIGG